jgi:mannose-6-phosphate isomerase
MKTYPIKFAPILKEKIWGGEKLHTLLHKKSKSTNVGESWEISGVKGNISKIINGEYQGKTLNEMLALHKASFLGTKNLEMFGENFPLLIKFLDANSNLSVQVHPDDEMAKRNHNSFGKTEMWYIMDSDENAEIVLGLKEGINNPQILRDINAQNVASVFNTEKVAKGDSYFIPAGKIHAIGAGVLAAEIQQTSDVTYRVYDWDREDADGNKRELHKDLAEKATKNFPTNGKSNYRLKPNQSSNLVDCEYFTTNIIKVNASLRKDYSDLDSFIIYMCVEGSVEIFLDDHKEFMTMGETVLIPAIAKQVFMNASDAKLLEIFINPGTQKFQKIAS